MANDFEEKAKEVVGGFYDLPHTAVQAARNGIKAARNVTEQDVVEGIRGATNAVSDTASTLGDGVMGGGRMVGAGAKAIANQTADMYNAAKPYLAAAGKGAAGGLQNMAGNIATGAGQLYDKAIAGAEDLGNQVPTVRGETQDFGAIPRAIDAAASGVGDFFTPSNPTANPLMVDRIGDAVRGAGQSINTLVGGGSTPASGPLSSLYNASTPAAGAQGGATSTTAGNIADQMAGVKKPEDAFTPVTEGSGIDIQAKAEEAKGNAPVAPLPSPTTRTQNESDYIPTGFNSPDTAPTRLPSVATGSPQGSLGAGNATGAAATGRTTGDGSSNPNSPNFQPVGLGGVPIQSRDEYLAQRAMEKQEVYNRRAASNANDRSRMQQESRQALFDKMVRDLPDNLTNRTKSITALYNSIMGDQVKSEGQDKTLLGARERNQSNETMANADNRAAATQNAFKNMMDQSDAQAAAEKAQRDEAYKQARLAQYQEGIDATAGKNAWQQRKAEYDVGFARAKNQREALAAKRADLKLASDMDVQGVNLPQLGQYQDKLNTVADLSGASDEQMAAFRAENPQRYQ